mgnify:CR=1 FL=1
MALVKNKEKGSYPSLKLSSSVKHKMHRWCIFIKLRFFWKHGFCLLQFPINSHVYVINIIESTACWFSDEVFINHDHSILVCVLFTHWKLSHSNPLFSSMYSNHIYKSHFIHSFTMQLFNECNNPIISLKVFFFLEMWIDTEMCAQIT